jgi:hypothetical protein
MTRGLLWLPLLAIFFGLAWAGWNEFQKLEAYRTWSQQFDHAKYDIYAVLGQKGNELTWGKPTRKGPVNLQTFSLQQVEKIQVLLDGQAIDLENPTAAKGQVVLEFRLVDSDAATRIPFTDLSLAIEWGKHLEQDWKRLQVE